MLWLRFPNQFAAGSRAMPYFDLTEDPDGICRVAQISRKTHVLAPDRLMQF